MPVNFLSSDEEAKLQKAREEYQPFFDGLGRPSPIPFSDDEESTFRRRALSNLQTAVNGFEDIRIDKYLREPNFKYIEKQIQDAARQEARNPTRIPDGELREVKTTDASGRPSSTFYGKCSSWMHMFGHHPKKVEGIRTETQRGWRP